MLHVQQPVTERDMRSHLRLIHGIYVYDEKTMQGLEVCHVQSHDDPDWQFVMKHEHRDPEPELEEEWEW